MADGIFIHLELSELQSMKAEWLKCLSAIATAHQQYSIAGRTFTRANLAEVNKTIGEISYAIALKTRRGGSRRTYADMSH